MKTGVLRRGDADVARVELARTLPARMRGLLGRRGLAAGHGMLIEPCGSIHTVGMAFVLDVVFLDRERVVRSIVRGVPPGRFVFGGRGARSVLELEAGWLPADALAVGDRLTLAERT